MLPPATSGPIIFGKNSNGPPSEVQEVVYIKDADHVPGSKVKVRMIYQFIIDKLFRLKYARNIED